MEFSWNDHQKSFREQVRSFIAEHWNEGVRRREGLQLHEQVRAYQQELADAGWLTMSWPKEYG